MTETPLVHLNQVFLAFNGKSVLNGVELKIFPRDRLVILGQSGGGKSTMLRLILGILKPTSGEIKYKHLRVSRLSRSKLNLLRSRMGMVYQYSALISSLNVRDNLALPVRELGRKSESEIDAMVEEKLAVVGMSGTESKLPSELSGGLTCTFGSSEYKDCLHLWRPKIVLLLISTSSSTQSTTPFKDAEQLDSVVAVNESLYSTDLLSGEWLPRPTRRGRRSSLLNAAK